MSEFPYLPWPVFRRSGVAAFDRSVTDLYAQTTAARKEGKTVEQSAGVDQQVSELQRDAADGAGASDL